MVTLKEIAEICNVSATTVSNVINGKAKTSEETKNRIMEVVRKTGYNPNYMAKGLRVKRTRTIAIIAEDLAQFTSPPIIENIMAYCEGRQYRATVYNLRLYDRWSDTWYNDEEEYKSVFEPVLRDVLSAQVDGIIYLAGHCRVIKSFSDDFPLPVVMCYALSDSPSIPSVVIDDEKSSWEMVSHLIKAGHKRIGFVGGRVENLHTIERLKGYQRALYENGILFDPSLVYYGRWDRESGYEGATKLLTQGVTAIFAISDRMAGGVYDFLYEAGVGVKDKIAVAGFDNEAISQYFRPALTTTELPLAEIGKKSAELILDRLEKKDGGKAIYSEPYVIKVSCTLKDRDSV